MCPIPHLSLKEKLSSFSWNSKNSQKFWILWSVYACIFIVNFLYVLSVQISSNTEFTGSYVQVLLNNSYAPLILSDALAIILIMTLPLNIQRVLFTLNVLFCAAIHNYLQFMGTPPTFTAFYNGLKYLSDLSVFSYISVPVLAWTMSILVVTHVCLCFVPKPPKPSRLALWLVIFLMALQVMTHINRPFSVILDQREDISAKLRSSLQLRGTLSTAFYEWLYNVHTMAEGVFSMEMVAPNHNLEILPKLNPKGNVVFIQVECLGYELLDAQVQGHYVMPFLHKLQTSSVVLKMDGEKLLGSANSDYEIFTTRKASKDFMAYDFVTDFSGNVVESLAQKNYNTRMFHNVYGNYMNLRRTYAKMGFAQRHFAEELSKAGYAPMQAWKGRIFSDENLFDFIIKKLPQSEQKTFDFIITISMHEPNYTAQNTQPFSSSPHAIFYKASFDTDKAMAAYYDTLKEGTMVVIYGDHRAYFGDPSPYVPFMVHIKGENITYKDVDTVYTRTDMSHYLRKILQIEKD